MQQDVALEARARNKSALKKWVAQMLDRSEDDLSLELIAGDASPRKYYRVRFKPVARGAASTVIAVDSPASEKNTEFLHVRHLFQDAGVRVPGLIAADLDLPALLLEDLGDDTLLPVLGEHSVGAWYGMALQALSKIAAIPVKDAGLAPYDDALLQREMNLFRDWFVPMVLRRDILAEESQVFEALKHALIKNAHAQPQGVVHRDFHARNLMVIENRELAVIDFQDAVVGPITYDAVSLLKDCYIQWPRRQQIAWLLGYRDSLLATGMNVPEDQSTWIEWFDLMGLQRHIKVLGIFVRLAERDGKSGYLANLPLVVAYVRESLALYAGKHPAVGAFQDWFESDVVPVILQQPWYQAVEQEPDL